MIKRHQSIILIPKTTKMSKKHHQTMKMKMTKKYIIKAEIKRTPCITLDFRQKSQVELHWRMNGLKTMPTRIILAARVLTRSRNPWWKKMSKTTEESAGETSRFRRTMILLLVRSAGGSIEVWRRGIMENFRMTAKNRVPGEIPMMKVCRNLAVRKNCHFKILVSLAPKRSSNLVAWLWSRMRQLTKRHSKASRISQRDRKQKSKVRICNKFSSSSTSSRCNSWRPSNHNLSRSSS